LLAAYVSGHGFGHATRTSEVLKALRRREPALDLAVATSGPEVLYRGAVPGELVFRRADCDVGLAQKDALRIDEEATAAACRAFAAGWNERVRSEASWLRARGARLVVGDIPPLAFAAAAEAGIPSVGIANFSWDWIYRSMSARHPSLLEAADAARDAYRRSDLLLRLPFAGDLGAFPRIEDLPLIARRPRVEPAEARRRLGLDGRPAVLLSFGGVGLPGFDASVLAPLRDLQFLSVGEWPPAPGNLFSFEPARLQALGLGYEDLVGAADVVVTKPGYGIVTDAIGGRTRVVYTERGDFAEYPILVEGMSRLVPSVHVCNEDLMAGRLLEPIRRVLAMPFPGEPDMSGADVAARKLLERAR
jgi:L-arabinokinase